jgi:Tfp pilus assembly protein FimT
MTSLSISSQNKGFTLIEIVVSIGILMMLFGLGLFMTMDAFRGYTFRSERDTIVSLLEKARSRSMANIAQTSWGVCYIAPDYVIFRGTTCTAGVATNENLSANAAVAAASNFSSTFPVIVFGQLSGTTTAANITVVEDARTSTISLNHEGTIIW